MKTASEIEIDYKALASYHLNGRLMLFAGLYSHELMNGAIVGYEAILGPERTKELIAELLAEGYKYKFQTIGDADSEFAKYGHHCFYCDKTKGSTEGSTTPRTDAEATKGSKTGERMSPFVTAEFARTLERNLEIAIATLSDIQNGAFCLSEIKEVSEKSILKIR